MFVSVEVGGEGEREREEERESLAVCSLFYKTLANSSLPLNSIDITVNTKSSFSPLSGTATQSLPHDTKQL